MFHDEGSAVCFLYGIIFLGLVSFVVNHLQNEKKERQRKEQEEIDRNRRRIEEEIQRKKAAARKAEENRRIEADFKANSFVQDLSANITLQFNDAEPVLQIKFPKSFLQQNVIWTICLVAPVDFCRQDRTLQDLEWNDWGECYVEFDYKMYARGERFFMEVKGECLYESADGKNNSVYCSRTKYPNPRSTECFKFPVQCAECSKYGLNYHQHRSKEYLHFCGQCYSRECQRCRKTCYYHEFKSSNPKVCNRCIQILRKTNITILDRKYEVLILDTKSKINKYMNLLLRDLKDEEVIVGIDTEWVDHNPVALLQIATEKKVFLIRLCTFQNIKGIGNLKRLLQKKNIIKVGLGVNDDSSKLANQYGLKCAPCSDIREICQPTRKGWGLKDFAKIHLGIELSKEDRLSDWEADELSDRQVEYAAKDAIVSRLVYIKLYEKKKLKEQEIELNIRKKRLLAETRSEIEGMESEIIERARSQLDCMVQVEELVAQARKKWGDIDVNTSSLAHELKLQCVAAFVEHEKQKGIKDKGPKLDFFCQVCNLKMNSRNTYESHIKGKKHRKRIFCNICNVQCETAEAYTAHCSSDDHLIEEAKLIASQSKLRTDARVYVPFPTAPKRIAPPRPKSKLRATASVFNPISNRQQPQETEKYNFITFSKLRANAPEFVPIPRPSAEI